MIKNNLLIEEQGLSESGLKNLIKIGQELYDVSIYTGKKEFIKPYPKDAFPRNELDFFKRKRVLTYSLHPTWLRHRVEILTSGGSLDDINSFISLEPKKLEELLSELNHLSNKKKKLTTDGSIIKTASTNQVKDSFKYELRLSSNNQILINDFVLTQPRSKENIEPLRCCIKNPGEKVNKAKIEKETNYKVSREFHSIISNYGFKPSIRKLFFPEITKEYIIFNNPVFLPTPLKFKK